MKIVKHMLVPIPTFHMRNSIDMSQRSGDMAPNRVTILKLTFFSVYQSNLSSIGWYSCFSQISSCKLIKVTTVACQPQLLHFRNTSIDLFSKSLNSALKKRFGVIFHETCSILNWPFFQGHPVVFHILLKIVWILTNLGTCSSLTFSRSYSLVHFR